jgi:riboflavin biosynthesis pyrimidine reductase
VRRLLPEPGDVPDDLALAEAYELPPGRVLRMDFIASLDGTIAVDGRSEGLQSPGDQRVFRTLRALADVVLVGHGTASAEGYGPVGPDTPLGRLRVRLGRPATVPIAVVSRRASLAPGDRLAVPGTLLVTCAAADADHRAALADAGVDVLVCGRDDVDLPSALDALAERGLEQVTCEGGPQLLRTALAGGVVDELDLMIAPALVGDAARLLDAPVGGVVRTELRQLLEEDGVLFARYGVQKQEAAGALPIPA